MGQEQAIQATDERSRLLAAARAMVLKGEKKFSISRLCEQAGLARASFAEYFSSRTELMAELMADVAEGAPVEAPVEMAGEDSGEETGEAPVEEFGETFAGQFAEAPYETSAEVSVEASVEAPIEVQPAEPTLFQMSAETSAEASVETQVQAPAPAHAAEVLPKAASEPSVSTPDAWLERRLRVFERALSALEAKSVTKEREQARVIAELEEKLALFQGSAAAPRATVPAEAQPAPATPTLRKARVAPIEHLIAPPEKSSETVSASPVMVLPAETAPEESEQPEAARPAPEKNPALLEVTPARAVSLSREEMAEVVNLARGRAKAAAAELDAMPPDRSRIRWLAVAGLSLLVLFLFIGLSLGKNSLTSGANAATADAVQDDGVTPRRSAQGPLAHMTALADAGDSDAQARLALIYLKGDGVAADPAAALRWARAAAETGQPVAEYLMGVFYNEGKVVRADDEAAFTWFSAAAIKGNLKAMHSLAIAYAQGQGTAKDEKQAAEWFKRAAERGYVDSAFDLALLYERGLGVPQDTKQALTWYGIAAQLGDVPAAERVVALQNQTSRQAAVLAAFAAKNFTPLTPLGGANRL
jgi:AcrR family transcriptional regulator